MVETLLYHWSILALSLSLSIMIDFSGRSKKRHITWTLSVAKDSQQKSDRAGQNVRDAPPRNMMSVRRGKTEKARRAPDGKNLLPYIPIGSYTVL
jgi:hypothetical protein